MKNIIIENIEAAKVVAIIRLDDSNSVPATINNLVAAGIKVLEITANTPNFCAHISWARTTYPDIAVGAGTIINPDLAKQAIAADAQFLVTPNMNPDVIDTAKAGGVVTLMGAITPTDVAIGINHGADFIKLFPAGPMGLAYFKALLGPYKGTRFIAVGGINTDNVTDWFSAGAIGVGVGGLITDGPADRVKENVEKLLSKINTL
jgi:2-dehydro-3-deoxyphosphogluconate aldolase/(4S)-4-hydroxy-2-oxoglutarate aldolase